MPLLKELIDIPERVHQGDFVLKLTEGIQHAEQTLRDYVVTPQLAASFDAALGFIKSAVETGSSKAAYLHGSFGSGKSHFMAVLSLLLAGNAKARSIPALAEVVARHNAWTVGRKFLVVPYHMIGAANMESAILGQYAEHVRRLHPEAPIPGFYQSQGLFHDAERLRRQMGDEQFFARLNEGRRGDGWGALGGGWDARSFEAAMLEPPASDEHMRLVGDLIECYFGAYQAMATAQAGGFVPLDAGLAIMSKHAQALGYHAVILFLDELILWLASRAADINFVSNEGVKLVKLVEATQADRPIPLVSFVARQRDLRELVGDTLAAGAVQTQLADSLKYWEARFGKVTLEDRNLPTIAEKRVLRPKSEAARAMIDTAFAQLLAERQDVLQILQTDDADREMFRKLYPFTPALVQTLIAVSSVLQRERTALKLMVQMLVDRRDELELGQVIGVGDLWDVIAEGDEPFSEGMRLHFENAKRLWQQKLLPLLERQHGVTWEQVQAGTAEAAKARLLKSDARVLKTLLLAALVPEVRPLRALTALRLAALNHGSFRSPIAGREGQDVLRKLRAWAAEVGEIKISDDPSNPTISIQVTGIDIEPIIESARVHDNLGNQRRLLREMVFAELGLGDSNELFNVYAHAWRGTTRQVDIVYENVRLTPYERLRAEGDRWTVVIDMPIDEPGFGPADDVAHLHRYQGPPSRTLAWIPQMLSERARRDLSRLVILEYLLRSEQRFLDASPNLSATDRAQARAIAANSRDQLRIRLRDCLHAAYGISEEPRDGIDRTIEAADQFASLDGTFRPQRPVGANLKEALGRLLDQALAHQFPAHPEFDQAITPGKIKKVWAEVERAAEQADHRVVVTDRGTRELVRSVVNPLKLGTMGETHLHLGDHWTSHFHQCLAREPGPLTVGRLRRWIDEPKPMGLPAEAQNLLILSFAALTNRSLRLRGGPAAPTTDSLADEIELVEQRLPAPEHWAEAVRRMSVLFGAVLPQTLNANNVAKLESALAEKLGPLRQSLQSAEQALKPLLDAYGGDAATAPRSVTLRSARALVDTVPASPAGAAAQALACAPLQTSEAAVARTLANANEIGEALRNLRRELFDSLSGLADHRAQAGAQILASLQEVLAADEHAVALRPALRELEARAIRLLAQPAAPAPVAPTAAPRPPHSGRVVQRGHRAWLSASEAKAVLTEIEREVAAAPTRRLDIDWSISEEGGAQ